MEKSIYRLDIGRHSLEKSNLFTTSKQKKVGSNWFTGKIKINEVSNSIKSKEHNVYHVTFKKNARTKLHQHNGGQTLIVTKGKGSLIFYKKTSNGRKQFKIKKTKTYNIHPGDVVYIPAKTLHTHGSTSKKNDFSHVAINSHPSRSKQFETNWYESDFKTTVIEKL